MLLRSSLLLFSFFEKIHSRDTSNELFPLMLHSQILIVTNRMLKPHQLCKWSQTAIDSDLLDTFTVFQQSRVIQNTTGKVGPLKTKLFTYNTFLKAFEQQTFQCALTWNLLISGSQNFCLTHHGFVFRITTNNLQFNHFL